MKITSIEVCRLERPAQQPHPKRTRPSYIDSAPHAFPINMHREFSRLISELPGLIHPEFWVKITVEDGTWGIGQGHWGDVAAVIIRNHFAPLLTGRDCFAHEFHNDLMWRYSQRFGSSGFASIARSAVDQALWDLKGKLLGKPVYSLLGGPSRDAVELYATTDDLDWAQELGFRAFKISNPAHYTDGLEGLNRLEEKVAKAREKVGPDAELMINPNMSYNVQFAVQVMERLAPYRLRWLEEPLLPGDLEGHIELKKSFPTVPIATGEDHHGRQAFRQLMEHRCVDIFQPDLRWCGGLTEGLKIYAIGEAAGIMLDAHVSHRHGIGVSGGQTLRYAVRRISLRRLKSSWVVGMMGAVTRGSGTNTFELSTALAQSLDVECHYLTAPIYCSTHESREVLLAHEEIASVMAKAEEAEIALVACGDLSHRSRIMPLGIIKENLPALLELGAVGEILGCFLDPHGNIVPHPINQSIMALPLSKLKEKPVSILASGGRNKLPIIRSVLRGKYVNRLVTDDVVARALIYES